MFTLCMSRGPPHRDSNNRNIENKQIKGGYLLRYRKGFFCNGWTEEWVVLYEDSTMAWFADKGLSRAKGYVRIGDAPDLLAVAEYTVQVPRRPRIPDTCNVGQLLAIGTGRASNDTVHWLLAQSPGELNDWMTAISNTLPPPDQIPIKRLSLTSRSNGCVPHMVNGNHHHQHHHHQQLEQQQQRLNAKNAKRQSQLGDADHTALSGVAIDWGHGWGWGQSAWMAHSACAHEHTTAMVHSAGLFCNGGEEYLGGYDEVDWSVFGDFSF